jgi:hypothetical protein
LDVESGQSKSSKSAKRNAARAKAKQTARDGGTGGAGETSSAGGASRTSKSASVGTAHEAHTALPPQQAAPSDNSKLSEEERRVRALRKKLRQVADIVDKARGGVGLTEAQQVKLDAAADW